MKFLTIFPYFESFHIYKDVGQVNFFVSKILGAQPNILSYNPQLDDSVNTEFKFLKIKEIFKRAHHNKLDLNIIIFLIVNARKFKFLNLYHPTFATQIYTILYKFINGQGKVYIKLDLDLDDARKNNTIPNGGIRNFIKRKIFSIYKNKADVVSVESEEAFELLLKRKTYNVSQLIRIPNGVSSENLNEQYGPAEYSQKENIILTIARIGTKQKNNELMLSALEKCNLKGWNYLFVGPIEKEFSNKINEFYKCNPHLINCVHFLGPKTRTEIVELYKKSKVFTLSSNYEGFPLVYAEASFFGCHIITTAVSGSVDITNSGTLGDIIPINNYILFHKAIQNVVDNNITYQHYENIRNFSIENFTWENILPTLTKKLSDG
jgi:glycosyltransferase involved in cell wall biosynthesis